MESAQEQTITILSNFVRSTPAYKLAKGLLPFLTPLTENEYIITDSFHFT